MSTGHEQTILALVHADDASDLMVVLVHLPLQIIEFVHILAALPDLLCICLYKLLVGLLDLQVQSLALVLFTADLLAEGLS